MARLSPRETEVFELFLTGVSDKEISAVLGIAVKTVEAHKRHVRDKLGVPGHDHRLTTYALKTMTARVHDLEEKFRRLGIDAGRVFE